MCKFDNAESYKHASDNFIMVKAEKLKVYKLKVC